MPLNIKLSLEELKKLSLKEREKYFETRRRLSGPKKGRKAKPTKKKAPSKRPKHHRDPGADDRMKKFEKSLREAGFSKGGLANCGASMKPTQKMSQGGYTKKK